MLHGTRALFIALAAAGAASLATIACGGGTQISEDTQGRNVQVVSPTGLEVSATISAASLGESEYQASNVQIAFFATQASSPAAVEVTNVALLDGGTGAVLATLASSTPQIWNGAGYVAWNQKVTPGGDLKASYKLSSPNWSSIGGGGSSYSSKSYSTPYKLRVTLRIDGTEVVLESAELYREPVMQT